MEGFFNQVETGAKGEAIYQPVSVAVREKGGAFLRVA
jgi:hypothetical protein